MIYGAEADASPASFCYRSQSTRGGCALSKALLVELVGVIVAVLFDALLLFQPPFVISFVQALPFPYNPTLLGVLAIVAFVAPTLTSLALVYRTRCRHAAVQEALRDFSVFFASSIRSIRIRNLNTLCQDCCNAAANVFVAALPKAGIGCAIRMADSGKGGYVTVARAGRLSKSREKSSQPVCYGRALASVLTSVQAQSSSVVLCPDVRRAQERGDLELDENSISPEFKDEVRSMLIARIESTDGYGEGELAGIFYVTSDKNNGLSYKDIDLMVTVSTMVSEVIRELLDPPSMSQQDYEWLLEQLSIEQKTKAASKGRSGTIASSKGKYRKTR